MSNDTFVKKLIRQNNPHDEAEIALELSEDRHLVALGIDPQGDPVERIALLRALNSTNS